eukprot:scaffold92204_cov93-Phaeocystis_antarctica.AAC.1
MDPYEEEQEILRENRAHSTPPSSENGDEEPRNADAAEAEHQPCRPGLQPKLNTVLCREACDAASGIGTFVRAEASLLYEGTTYNWPMAKEEDGFDGAGPFLASRMPLEPISRPSRTQYTLSTPLGSRPRSRS